MKTIGAVIKVLTAIATVAGAIYIIATYGDKIVAWAKEMMAKFPCQCPCDATEEAPAKEAAAEEAPAEEEAAPAAEEAEAPAEEPAAEEAPAEEPAAEEAPAAEVDAPVADEADFEG